MILPSAEVQHDQTLPKDLMFRREVQDDLRGADIVVIGVADPEVILAQGPAIGSRQRTAATETALAKIAQFEPA